MSVGAPLGMKPTRYIGGGLLLPLPPGDSNGPLSDLDRSESLYLPVLLGELSDPGHLSHDRRGSPAILRRAGRGRRAPRPALRVASGQPGPLMHAVIVGL